MRIVLISDIHGNFTALKAVLDEIEKEKVDSIICLGDVATIGPQPKAVIEKLRKLECTFIMGNHDKALLETGQALNLKIAPPLIPLLEWCNQRLNQDDLDFLKSFKATHPISFNQNESLLCYHGSPQSNIKNVLATIPETEMDSLFGPYNSTMFAGGHTHIQMLRQHNGKLFINPGSIGMPFHHTPTMGEEPRLLPFAEYAVLQYKNNTLSVDLRRINFDIEEYKKVIADSDLPIKESLLGQFKFSK